MSLFVQPPNEPNWHGAYLKKGLPADPWDHAYVYRSPGSEGREYEIMSYGADGQQDGAGEDADVTSWN